MGGFAKFVDQFIGNWHGNCKSTTILKLRWDFGPRAVGYSFGAFKLKNVLIVGGIEIANRIEN